MDKSKVNFCTASLDSDGLNPIITVIRWHSARLMCSSAFWLHLSLSLSPKQLFVQSWDLYCDFSWLGKRSAGSLFEYAQPEFRAIQPQLTPNPNASPYSPHTKHPPPPQKQLWQPCVCVCAICEKRSTLTWIAFWKAPDAFLPPSWYRLMAQQSPEQQHFTPDGYKWSPPHCNTPHCAS